MMTPMVGVAYMVSFVRLHLLAPNLRLSHLPSPLAPPPHLLSEHGLCEVPRLLLLGDHVNPSLEPVLESSQSPPSAQHLRLDDDVLVVSSPELGEGVGGLVGGLGDESGRDGDPVLVHSLHGNVLMDVQVTGEVGVGGG